MIQTKNTIPWWQYAYYIALLFVMTTWTSTTSSPPLAMRLLFMGALFIVPIITEVSSLPAVVSSFFIVSSYGFSNSYLPSAYYLYCIPIAIGLLIYGKKKVGDFHVPSIVVFLCIYSLLVNFVTSGVVQNLTYCMFILASFVVFSDTKTEIDIKTIAVFFTIASLVLSVFYFTSGSEFTRAYDQSSGLERTGWTDSNYFSTTIGFSVLVSIAMLISQKNSIIETILFVTNIIASTIVMVLVASRGGILSLAAGVGVLLLFSKLKTKYKILVVALIAAFIVYLFNNDYFALLQYRIEMDETGGSGRTEIWVTKLTEFFNSSPFVWIFGMGFWNGSYLGGSTTDYMCFHNDYFAYLVCYGIIGLMALIALLVYPLRNANKKHNIYPMIVSLVIYLAVTSLTLQPLCEGYLAYFYYYFFILLLMQHSKTDSLEHE